MKIIESRNKREGRYLGWRVTGKRHMLSWRTLRQVNHERAGRIDVATLKEWAQALKGGFE